MQDLDFGVHSSGLFRVRGQRNMSLGLFSGLVQLDPRSNEMKVSSWQTMQPVEWFGPTKGHLPESAAVRVSLRIKKDQVASKALSSLEKASPLRRCPTSPPNGIEIKKCPQQVHRNSQSQRSSTSERKRGKAPQGWQSWFGDF